MASTRQKLIRDGDPQRTGLRRSVLAEAGVAVVLLAVTTVLTSTEPGRTAEQEAERAGSAATAEPAGPAMVTLPFDTGGKDGRGTIRFSLDPAGPGPNVADIYVDDSEGRAMNVAELKFAFTLTAKKIGPLPVVPERAGDGKWTADPVLLPMPGDWKLEVTVRTSDIDQITVDKNVKIG